MVAIAMITGIGMAGDARGQTASPDSAVANAALADTLSKPKPKWELKSDYNGGIRGSVSDVSMRHRISALLGSSGGLNVNGSLESTERQFRLQNRRNDSNTFNAGISTPRVYGFLLSASFSDARFFDRVVTAQNTLQDFKNDTQRARGSAVYLKPLPNGIALDAKSEAGINRSEQTFENTRAIDGLVGGGFRWGKAKSFSVSGRAYIKLSAEESEPVGLGTTIKGLGGDEDSLSTAIKYWVHDSTTVAANYSRYTKTREFMDLPRGVFLDQQFEGNLIRETETRTSDVLRLSAETVPLQPVLLKLSGEHRVNLSDFAVATRRYQQTTEDRLEGTLTYRMPKNMQFSGTLENSETIRDLGPQSLGSYSDKRKTLRLSLQVPLTTTFQVQLQTGTSIVQTFYADFENNPRDRDQLDQYANIRITSRPFSKIGSLIYLAFNRTDYVNIDGSLSQNNRAESTWDFRPEFTYKVNERIELKQTYGVNLELTEYDFVADDNFLDRSFTFNNLVKARILPAVSTEVRYSLLLHDRGSYLTPPGGGERLLSITQEDRRDEMLISFRYRMSEHLTAVGENIYSQRRDVFAGGNRTNRFTDGTLNIGIEGNYDWGEQRKLNFRVKRVKKFGRFNSPEQEDYWEMDSTLAYKF